MQVEEIKHKSHYFQDQNIEIQWIIFNSFQKNQLPAYQICFAQQNEDFGFGPGIGAKVLFRNQQEMIVCKETEGEFIYCENGEWLPFQPEADKISQQIYLNDKQNQTYQKVLSIQVTDYKKLIQYEGSISETSIIELTEDLADLDDVFNRITQNIQLIFDDKSQVYLESTETKSQLSVKLESPKGKKIIQHKIQILLQLIEMDKNGKEKIKKDLELKQQKLRLDLIDERIQSEEKRQEKVIEDIKTLLNENEKQKLMLEDYQKQIQQQQIKIEQQQNIIQNNESQFSKILESLNQKIRQLEQFKQIKQQQQAQKLFVENLQQKQNYNFFVYLTEKLKGCYEFELNRIEDEIPFKLGIIVDGDLQYLEKKTKTYFITFPEGNLKRGNESQGQFINYLLQIDDKVGLRVDSTNYSLQLIINDYPLTPIRISEQFEEFSFILISDQPLETFAQTNQQLN
ncbi:unnamed protein product [Paramecium sonneborni]|uniref:Uncharacterized protein n=1 Tax=Paramecium sonneborni TaxID=65129 RepID=A0A8S1R1M6_9CILI|nr:unnamed protein product [Paramecium sonneborni]